MTDDATVNSQILDAVNGVVTLSTAQSPSQALGMLDAVFLETLGMAMYNAVNRQQNAGMVSSAAVTATCAKMLSAPFPIALPPRPPEPAPQVNPLAGPPSSAAAPAATAAAALATGESAVLALKTQAQDLSAEAAVVQANLEKLAKDAAPPPASPASGASTDTPAPAS